MVQGISRPVSMNKVSWLASWIEPWEVQGPLKPAVR